MPVTGGGVGIGVGVGVGAGVGVGVGTGVGPGVGKIGGSVGKIIGVPVGSGSGVAVGLGVDLGVGFLVGTGVLFDGAAAVIDLDGVADGAVPLGLSAVIPLVGEELTVKLSTMNTVPRARTINTNETRPRPA